MKAKVSVIANLKKNINSIVLTTKLAKAVGLKNHDMVSVDISYDGSIVLEKLEIKNGA